MSVRIALEFAISIAPPTPCASRITISQTTAPVPCIHVTESRIEKTVNTAKPALYMRTRPYMSPSRPNVTTRTAVTSM